MAATIDGFYEFEQAYRMTQHGRVTAAVAADALLALERITLRTPRAINRLAGRPAVRNVDLYIKRLEEGSLFHDYYVRVFFGTPEKEAEFYAWLRERTGLNQSKVKTLFAVLGAGVVAAGATYAVNKYAASPDAKEGARTVVAWNNTIIQIGAGELKMSPQEFAALLDRSIPRKSSNAKDAARLLLPAKEEGEPGGMEFVGFKELSVPAAVVAAMPTPDEIDDTPADKEVLYPKHDVYLRASDLDSTSRGWAALVPDIADQRLKLELGDGINPDAVYGKKKIVADVVAVMRPKKGDVSVPVRYRIVKIHED